MSIVILAFLTNCVVDGMGEEGSGGDAALSQTLMQLFTNASGIFSFCQSYPTVRVFLSPPSVRNKPSWYSRSRPTILKALHQLLLTRPVNLQVLEDCAGDLDPDGIHYSIMAGINYVKDLHDQAVQLMQFAPPDPKIR